MISVVIPLYNKATYISRTLSSAMMQTFRDFEIVVVDDGSTDDSAAVVESLDISCLRLIKQENAGVSAARNRGIEEAKGEFIAFLDADDVWKPNYLKTQMSLVEKYPQCDVFATNYEFCDKKGKVTPTIIRKLPFDGEDGELENYFEVSSCSHPPICSISIMVRKMAIISIGGFPVGIKLGEDLLTWARLAVKYRIAYSTISSSVYHVEEYGIKEKPKRVPPDDDVVGKELELIAKTYHPHFINRYISHWHKMRSSIFLRLSMRKKSICEAIRGLRFWPWNFKLYIYIILNLIPRQLRPF